MAKKTNLQTSAYLAKGIIGKAGTPGAPIVHFSLVVVPGEHKVSGSVYITQAVRGGNYTGHVTGTIYATGLGKITRIISISGHVHPDGPMPLEIQFEAHMAVDNLWNGTGGFHYANTHVENVPVKSLP